MFLLLFSWLFSELNSLWKRSPILNSRNAGIRSMNWISELNSDFILFYFINKSVQIVNKLFNSWMNHSVRFVMCIRGSLKRTHSKEKFVQWSVSWVQSPESKIRLQRLVNNDWIRIFGWPVPLIPTTYSSSTRLDSVKPVILLKI